VTARLVAVLLFAAAIASAQVDPAVSFRTANESAARSRWDEAIEKYARLADSGVRAPSLYWNWSQAASANGRQGEAVWSLMCARQLVPGDESVHREIERLRAELGLDPSEISLGLAGDALLVSRRFHLEVFAALAFIVTLIGTVSRRLRTAPSLGFFLAGVLFLAPFWMGSFQGSRAVVIRKDAPLVDIPRNDAVPLATLREGEVIPVLAEEGDYFKVQDASGARGFAHKSNVRRIAD